jgi:hypothetical protein
MGDLFLLGRPIRGRVVARMTDTATTSPCCGNCTEGSRAEPDRRAEYPCVDDRGATLKSTHRRLHFVERLGTPRAAMSEAMERLNRNDAMRTRRLTPAEAVAADHRSSETGACGSTASARAEPRRQARVNHRGRQAALSPAAWCGRASYQRRLSGIAVEGGETKRSDRFAVDERPHTGAGRLPCPQRREWAREVERVSSLGGFGCG